MYKIILILLFSVTLCHAYTDFNVVSKDPVQEDLSQEKKKVIGPYTLLMKSKFVLDARIVSAKKYDWDSLSEIIPVDLGVAWGKMSETRVMNQVNWSQSNRFLDWSVSGRALQKLNISKDYMISHVSNVHLIPGHPKIRQILQSLGKYDMVHIKGYLTDVYMKNKMIKTSMRRDDSGAGACEVIYVTGIKVKRSSYQPNNLLGK